MNCNLPLKCYLFLIPHTGNGIGNACEDDSDGDGVPDIDDVCPDNPLISATDFKRYQQVILDPLGDSQIDPIWSILNNVSDKQMWMNL